MIIKKIFCIMFAGLLCLCNTLNIFASEAYYLPDVTREMSSPLYWSAENEVLMTYGAIEKLNEKTIAQKGTNMNNLYNAPLTVDGFAVNEAVKKSSKSDAEYYLGWTYLQKDTIATQEEFDVLIENTQNKNPEKEQNVLFGIAVERTELRTFPSPVAIWDDPLDIDLDYQYLVGVRVNEPVYITSVSGDGKYYLAKGNSCSGWIPVESVAICKDKEEWISVWDIQAEDAFVVWGNRVYTEMSATGKETSQLMLPMGTVLKLAKDIDPNTLIDNRAAYNNYAVWIPIKKDDGSFAEKLTLISENNDVCAGFLPLTKQNVAKVAFSCLGDTYGWGAGLKSEDCSSYMRNVYKCFGFELARNGVWQAEMPMAKIKMQYMCREERVKILKALPIGTLLFFSGHEMMYLGERNGKFYVISAVGSMMQPENEKVRQRIRSTVINTLDVKRANGNTWLDELTAAIVPYFDVEENDLPQYEWYHEGVEFCLKNKIMQGDENKLFNPSKNITWAELLQILHNMEDAKTTFEEKTNWYDTAVKWAEDSNVIYENDKEFNPESSPTRQQLAAVLYLYAKYKGYDVSVGEETNILSYDDVFDVSDYAVSAMQYIVGSGIIKGKSITTLNPKDSTTRAEVAVILKRFVDYNAEMTKTE